MRRARSSWLVAGAMSGCAQYTGLEEQLGERVHVFVKDLGMPDAADTLVKAAEEKMGQIDILVNNAGLTKDGLFMRMKDEDWQIVQEVDLFAPFRLTRAAIRGMMKRRNGRVINITSVVGVTGNPGQANYCAAKAGMIGMTKSMAQEVANRGITLNCIAPGFIATPMTRGADRRPESQSQRDHSRRNHGYARRYRKRLRLPRQR